VGHHPRLNPVPGVVLPAAAAADHHHHHHDSADGAGNQSGGGNDQNTNGKRGRTLGGGGGRCGGGVGGGGGGGGSGFVFVLNPELDWNDVSFDTRVRMKTLVAETGDTFAHKYKKRKSGDWVGCCKLRRVDSCVET